MEELGRSAGEAHAVGVPVAMIEPGSSVIPSIPTR